MVLSTSIVQALKHNVLWWTCWKLHKALLWCPMIKFLCFVQADLSTPANNGGDDDSSGLTLLVYLAGNSLCGLHQNRFYSVMNRWAIQTLRTLYQSKHDKDESFHGLTILLLSESVCATRHTMNNDNEIGPSNGYKQTPGPVQWTKGKWGSGRWSKGNMAPCNGRTQDLVRGGNSLEQP